MIGIGAVHRQLARVFGTGAVAGLDEHQLLSRFIDRADEAAFEALLARHGPMVLGVCRRSLADPHDAEDAFQAVFLILVKKAHTLRHRDALGPWLYGVARRVASRAAAQRRRRERPAPVADLAEAPTVDPAADLLRAEARAALDDALAALPTRFRAPMVLCYLEGLTHPEAAARLNIPVGTVRSRLAWARARMKTKLARLGLVAPATALLAETIAEAAVPIALTQATLQAALYGPELVPASPWRSSFGSATMTARIQEQGGRPMDAEPQPDDDLEGFARRWQGTRAWTRVRAILLVRRGRTAPQVAEALGCCLRSVRQWIALHRDGGAAALADRPRSGRPTTLSRADEARLKARLAAGPTAADGVCTLRGQDIRRILAEEFDARYTVDGVYALLHRIGQSSLMPRPRHRKADPEAQEAFRKGPPSGSGRSPRAGRPSGSRSSSRTRPASARRAR